MWELSEKIVQLINKLSVNYRKLDTNESMPKTASRVSIKMRKIVFINVRLLTSGSFSTGGGESLSSTMPLHFTSTFTRYNTLLS